MKLPKYNLIYYKSLIERCFIHFFNDYNYFFEKFNGNYYLFKDPGKTKLKTIFKKYFMYELKKILIPYSILEPEYFIIIGSCWPKNNYLLKYIEKCPQKLNNILNSDYQIKYLLKEKDIKLDLIRFNQIIIEIFQDFFKKYNKQFKNVLFIQHSKLDCQSLFKILKYHIGKSNCINLYKEKMYNDKQVLISINDLIDRYAVNKQNLNKDKEFIKITNEIKQYLIDCNFYG